MVKETIELETFYHTMKTGHRDITIRKITYQEYRVLNAVKHNRKFWETFNNANKIIP